MIKKQKQFVSYIITYKHDSLTFRNRGFNPLLKSAGLSKATVRYTHRLKL